MTTVKEIMQYARNLLAREGGWTQGCLGRDANGNEVLNPDDAVCFCSIGALALAKQNLKATYDRVAAARNRLKEILEVDYLSAWNDAPGRTQAEVVALFDEGIAQERT